jgi:hypothetical protein
LVAPAFFTRIPHFFTPANSPYWVGEVTLAQGLWNQIPDHSLTCVDRNFVNYAVLYRIQTQGQDRHWMLRAKKNLRWRVLRSLGDGSDLVELTLSPPSRRKDPTLPRTLRARAIPYQRKGFRPQMLLTSLVDPVRFPAAEVAPLYHERWECEGCYDQLKTHTLERKEAHLRSRQPQRIRQEAWGLLVAYNLVRVQMMVVAREVGVIPRRISFWNALLIIRNVWISAALVTAGCLPTILQAMRRDLQLLILPERRLRSARREVKIKMSGYPKKRRTHHVNG